MIILPIIGRTVKVNLTYPRSIGLPSLGRASIGSRTTSRLFYKCHAQSDVCPLSLPPLLKK